MSSIAVGVSDEITNAVSTEGVPTDSRAPAAGASSVGRKSPFHHPLSVVVVSDWATTGAEIEALPTRMTKGKKRDMGQMYSSSEVSRDRRSEVLSIWVVPRGVGEAMPVVYGHGTILNAHCS